MTDEPVYFYKKGEGWVVDRTNTPSYTGIPQHVITLRCSTVVRIEVRQPDPGEYCIHIGKDSIASTNNPTLAHMLKYIANSYYLSFIGKAPGANYAGTQYEYYVVTAL